jgi:hypothetical protein
MHEKKLLALKRKRSRARKEGAFFFKTGTQPDSFPVIVAKHHLHRAVEQFKIKHGKRRNQISCMNDQRDSSAIENLNCLTDSCSVIVRIRYNTNGSASLHNDLPFTYKFNLLISFVSIAVLK